MKKWILKTLTVLCVASMLAACGPNDTTVNNMEDNENENVNIEFMLLNGISGDGAEFVPKKILEDKFNVTINFSLNNNSAHFEKLNLLIASNELSDITSPMPVETAKTIGPKGALVKIDEYLDSMPNFKRYLEKDPQNILALTAGDGHIYSLPRFAKGDTELKWTPMIREDYLEETGLGQPSTYAELYEVLRRIKELHPDTVGMVNCEGTAFLNAYGLGYNTYSGMFYNNVEDKFEYGPTNKGYKELVGDFAKLWKDGVLDKEFFTASEAQWQEKFLNGSAVFTLNWPAKAATLTESYLKLNPDDTKFKISLIDPLTTDNYDKMRLYCAETLGLWTSWAISSNASNIPRIIKLADYMYSDEAEVPMQWGIEGETYELTSDGKYKFADYIKAGYNPNGTVESQNTLGLNNNRLMRVENSNGVSERAGGIEKKLEYYRQNAEICETNYKINLTFTEDQNDRIEEINMVLETMVNENAVAFISGTRDISEYDAYVQEVKNMGGAELEEIYAEAYAAYKEKLAQIKEQ